MYPQPSRRAKGMPNLGLPSLKGASAGFLRSCTHLRVLYYDDPAGDLQDLLHLQTLEELEFVTTDRTPPSTLNFLFTDGRKQLARLRSLTVHNGFMFGNDLFYLFLYEKVGVMFKEVGNSDPNTFMLNHDGFPMPPIE
ncbi:hypothetical protein EMMF5_004141 [Cystobasidiomycetes sp. EMM_F5]